MPEIKSDTGGIPPGYYTRGEAATKIGRKRDTLKLWARKGVFVPRYFIMKGDIPFSLYDEDDIVAMKAIAANMRPGRKKKT